MCDFLGGAIKEQRDNLKTESERYLVLISLYLNIIIYLYMFIVLH